MQKTYPYTSATQLKVMGYGEQAIESLLQNDFTICNIVFKRCLSNNPGSTCVLEFVAREGKSLQLTLSHEEPNKDFTLVCERYHSDLHLSLMARYGIPQSGEYIGAMGPPDYDGECKIWYHTENNDLLYKLVQMAN